MHNEGFGNEVMQRLLLGSERRHDEPDAENAGREVFGEVPARGSRKVIRPPSAPVSDRHRAFADSRLPFRTQHEGLVKPRSKNVKTTPGNVIAATRPLAMEMIMTSMISATTRTQKPHTKQQRPARSSERSSL
jgi:hypothetical protein